MSPAWSYVLGLLTTPVLFAVVAVLFDTFRRTRQRPYCWAWGCETEAGNRAVRERWPRGTSRFGRWRWWRKHVKSLRHRAAIRAGGSL